MATKIYIFLVNSGTIRMKVNANLCKTPIFSAFFFGTVPRETIFKRNKIMATQSRKTNV